MSSPRPVRTTSRQASTPALRRTSEIVLVTGTVLAVLSVFGPLWVTRAGIGIAVTAAVLACVLAWRELFHAERRHASSLLETTRRHGQQLREERRRNAEVVETLTARVQTAARTIDGQQVRIAALRHEVFTLEGDRTSLRSALRDRERTVASLRTTVQRRDVEVGSLRAELNSMQEDLAALQADTAEVHHLPRRVVQAELAAVSVQGPSDVLDLRTLDSVRSVLPNYEADRRLA